MEIQKDYRETSDSLFSQITRNNYRKLIPHLNIKQRKFLLSYLIKEKCDFTFQIYYALINDCIKKDICEEYQSIYLNGIKKVPDLFSLQLLNYENMMRMFDERRVEEIFKMLQTNIGRGQFSNSELLDILEVITIPEGELQGKNLKTKLYLQYARQIQKQIFRKLKDYEDPEVVERLRDIIQELPHQYIPYFNHVKEIIGKSKTAKMTHETKK